MRKLVILLALGVVALPSLAKAADVVTEMCVVNTNSAKQLLAFIEASAGVLLPLSCKGVSANCTQCDADLLSEGFELSKATQANMNPYLVFREYARG
jgi:hypothetical protein